MKWLNMQVAAGFCLAAIASAPARAAVPIDTDFNLTAVSVTPNTDDVAVATSISFFLLPISNVTTDNTGIILFGTLAELTNPVLVGVGNSLSFSWSTPDGIFSDPLKQTKVTGVPDTLLTIISLGTVLGPSGFSSSPAQLTLVFREFGVGSYSLSGHFETVPGSPVPEASTWLMMVGGFGGLGLAGYRRVRKALA